MSSTRLDALLVAHVGPQDIGNRDGAVAVLVELQNGNQDPWARDAGVIQRVDEACFAIGILVLDVQSPCLELTQIGT